MTLQNTPLVFMVAFCFYPYERNSKSIYRCNWLLEWNGKVSYFDNVITKFIFNNRTDAWKTDVNLSKYGQHLHEYQPRSQGLSSSLREDERPWERGCMNIWLIDWWIEYIFRLLIGSLNFREWNYQSINRTLYCVVTCLIDWVIDWLIDRPTERPTVRTADRTADRTAERTPDRQIGRSINLLIPP